MTVLPETITENVTTGHDAHHVALHKRYNFGDSFQVINVKDPAYGAVGDGVANDTAAIAAAYAACPAGGTLYFPNGVYLTDPLVITKCIHVLGEGRWSSWLKARTAITVALIEFDIAAPIVTTRNVYGASITGIGVDLSAASGGTGFETSATTGWFHGSDLYCTGGAVSVDNKGTNNTFEWCRFVDAGIFFKIDGETGLELNLRHIDCIRFSVGTTTAGIEVVCTSGGTHGALYIDKVVINATPIVATLSAGLLVSSVSANLSVPVFANQLVVDNAAGPGVKLVNVRDVHIADSWLNSAAGVLTAVEIAGGGNLKFSGNTYFGGTRGTYEFTGSNACVGFISKGNYCPSAYVYRLTGAGKPTDMFLDDFVPGATVDSQITDDLPNLVLGVGKTWGAREFRDYVHLQQGTVHTIGTGSEPAFTNSWANVLGYAAYFYKDSMDIVHLSGQLASGVAVGAFTLPAGFRPTFTKHFTAIHDDGSTVVLEVTSGGVVQIYDSFPAAALSIDCSFLAGA